MRKYKMQKQQAAMEFMATYWWAILIIAIVLFSFIYLGFSSPYASAPKVQPGNCKVLRPYGPNTTVGIALEGECANILPEFALQFQGVRSAYVDINASAMRSNTLTVTFWFKVNNYCTLPYTSGGTTYCAFQKVTSTGPATICGIGMGQAYNQVHVPPIMAMWVSWNDCGYGYAFSGNAPLGQWTFAAISTNGLNAWGGFD